VVNRSVVTTNAQHSPGLGELDKRDFRRCREVGEIEYQPFWPSRRGPQRPPGLEVQASVCQPHGRNQDGREWKRLLIVQGGDHFQLIPTHLVRQSQVIMLIWCAGDCAHESKNEVRQLKTDAAGTKVRSQDSHSTRAPAPLMMGNLDSPPIRDRIRELRRVRAADLIPNPKNWRLHPKAQADALRGLLTELGYADALLVRELADGKLLIIDGHLRAQTKADALVPVLVLDLTEEEADKLLSTLDPLGSMAERDTERFRALLETVRSDNSAVQELLRRTAGEPLWAILHPDEIKEAEILPERAEELRAKWGAELGQV
jgi:hypothetical protein